MKGIVLTVRNTSMIDFPCWSGEVGSLVAIEAGENIPFPVNRTYYIFDVGPQDRRGFHSHIKLHQVLICVRGSVRVLVEDGESAETVFLNDPTRGLYIGPMVWREMFDFSEDAVLLVLASRHYEESDYIRDHEEFERRSCDYFARLTEEE